MTSPTTPNRRVLIVSAAFPPTGGAGVQRTAKFARYLPDQGFDPIVWTAGPLGQLPRDDSLASELPRSVSVLSNPNHDLAGPLAAFADRSWRLARLTRRLERFFVPDSLIPWVLTSLAPLRRLIHTHRIDLIYSTYSPASNHLLAWMLKRATRRPWISDWRDLWTEDHWYQFRTGPAWRRKLDRRLERTFLRASDAIVATTDAQRNILTSALSAADTPLACTIPNGFDPADFSDTPCRSNPQSRDRFVLAHVGRFTRDRVKPPMLEGLARFAGSLGPRGDRFQLRIVGHIPCELRDDLHNRGVPVETTGYLPHRLAVAEMQSADVLLLQYPDAPNADTAVSGKLFEYFAAGRPVLMIGPPSSQARRYVESFRAGITADMDAADVAAALTRLWQRWRSGDLPAGCSADRLAPFTRPALTQRLARLFDHVLATARARAKRRTSTTRRTSVGRPASVIRRAPVAIPVHASPSEPRGRQAASTLAHPA